MAHKRMFSKDITTSDAFREMPPSSQALYFHLGMEADDDGFLDNYRGLMRAVNASEDDLRVLIGKRFLILFPSKIIVVKHWKINNTIKNDRYNETKHLEEKGALVVKENGAYTERIHSGSKMEPQYRIGKDRIGKDRIEEDRRESVTELFDLFWEKYPKKVGKGEALRSWSKLRPSRELAERIIASVIAHFVDSQWVRDGGRFIPNPSTFLNQGRYDDEVAVAKSNVIKL